MEDQELAAIRAARLAQLQQQGASGGQRGDVDDEDDDEGAQDAAAAKQNAEEQMRRDLLATVLDSAARERLARIALVSPTRSKQIESILLRMATSGQLRGRIGEAQLIGLLEQAEEAQSRATGTKKGTIMYQRRKEVDEDDDFDI